ncbi:hypothetical protein [Snodgrassella alvi]|nr:hypothetical protein [Snodgrassella alvi]
MTVCGWQEPDKLPREEVYGADHPDHPVYRADILHPSHHVGHT